MGYIAISFFRAAVVNFFCEIDATIYLLVPSLLRRYFIFSPLIQEAERKAEGKGDKPRLPVSYLWKLHARGSSFQENFSFQIRMKATKKCVSLFEFFSSKYFPKFLLAKKKYLTFKKCLSLDRTSNRVLCQTFKLSRGSLFRLPHRRNTYLSMY